MSNEIQIVVRPNSDPAPALPALAPPLAGVEPPPIELSKQQLIAIEWLAKGESVVSAAEAAKVDRTTVNRWKKHDPNFIAALNRWRGEIQSEVRDRLLALTSDATDAVSKTLKGGDGKVGFRYLDKMGCVKPGPDHPVDPHEIFGNGIDDETGRWRIAEGMQRVATTMTPEQQLRTPQLLALGVVMDNVAAGHPSSAELLEMAGPLPHQRPPELTSPIESPAAPMANRAKGASACNPSAGVAPPPPVQVKVRVVRDTVAFGATCRSQTRIHRS